MYMPKFIYLFVVISFISPAQSAFAQGDSTLTKKITNDFCNEFSKKDFSKLKGFEMELGLLVVPIIEKYSSEIKKEWSLAPENEEDYEKISEKIGREAPFLTVNSVPGFAQITKWVISTFLANYTIEE